MALSTSSRRAKPVAYFHEIYDELAALVPEKIAVVSRGRERLCLTYASIRERSFLLAAGLAHYLAECTESAGPCELLECRIAVQLPRTHSDFVPLLVAASRVGVPFVLLSTDLPDSSLQDARNEFAVQLLKPQFCITQTGTLTDSSVATGEVKLDCATITVDNLLHKPWMQGLSDRNRISACPDIFCFMFTGGSNRTKVVQATHAMVLHERIAYSELWQPSLQPAVVLAHTSVYWGASALGQLSIALAYNGTIVWTESSEAADLKRCVVEEKVNILGVVPDHLNLLAPESPSRELPNIEVIFTWGERLPRRTADRWRDHPQAIIRELLIATEYWLSLWADPLGDGVLRTVQGTKLLVLQENGNDASVGEVGELMIAGPMVMAGYYGSTAETQEIFHQVGEQVYFRTRDLVRRVSDGIVYKGRADMMTKHKGKWVDLLVIEDQLSQLKGVRAAKVLPDPVHEHYHAFFALEGNVPIGSILSSVRMALPPRLQLWLVPDLPRHAVTRKVDATKLSKILRGLPPSWPVDTGVRFSDGPPKLRQRLTKKMCRQLCWQLTAFGAAWAVADPSELVLQLSLVGVYLPVVAFVSRHCRENDLPIRLAFTTSWVMAVVLARPPSIARLARGTLSIATFTYAWLMLTYADSWRASSSVARAIMTVVDEIPLWKFGAFISLSLGQHWPGVLGSLSSSSLMSLAFGGLVCAFRRHRVVAWPIVFWTLGIGHQLGIDCRNWLDPSFWSRTLWSRSADLWRAGEALLHRITNLHLMLQQPAHDDGMSVAMTAANLGVTSSESYSCSRCGAQCGAESSRWPARDGNDNIICDACAARFCADTEAAAAEWMSSKVVACSNSKDTVVSTSNATVDRMSKIPRTETAKPQQTLACKSEDRGASVDRDYLQNAADQDWQRRQNEHWWWKHVTQDTFDIDGEEECRIISTLNSSSAFPASQAAQIPPEMRLLCSVVGEIEPLLKPVHGETVLIGIDSLQIARLTNAIRIQLGVSLSVQLLREAKTVRELAATIAKAEAAVADGAPNEAQVADDNDTSREYAVWYSPGQYRPMGNWILRSEEPLDHAAFVRAAQLLVDRHAAWRAQTADPLRYMSLLYDAAVVYSLYAPFLLQGSWIARKLCRLISWAFVHAWPRVKVCTREELYRTKFPETLAPVEILQIHGGQAEFERVGKHFRMNLLPPGRITGYELVCHLADVWEFHETQWRGNFVIMKVPEGLEVPEDVKLVYVDVASNEWGPLIGPGSSQWQVPPYGFPALFFIPLSTGSLCWVRLEQKDELRFCYREGSSRSRWNRRLVAYRAAPRRGYDYHTPLVITFLSFGMFHCFSDGNCYLPLVQDFTSLYDAARGHAASRLPPIGNAFEELERRLFDTFNCRPSPMRASLRGSIYGYRGHGYGYTLGLGPGAISALTRTAVHYRVPLDVVLLGIVACGMARADHSEFCDFTLYTPMRDGASEAMLVGLFSDWRDLYASIDFDLATVLGTILQLYHKIQHRQWSVFNALRKDERTVVNIQPLDFEKHAGFKNLGENMWRDGDRLNEHTERSNRMDYAQQPANFTIEQQDEETWWILVGMGYNERPTPWMRRLVFGFEDALNAFLFEPLARVHQPYPDDDTLLRIAWERERLKGGPVCLHAPR